MAAGHQGPGSDRCVQAGYVASGGGRGVTVRLGKAAAVSFPPDKGGRLKGRYVVDATGYAYTAILLSFVLWPLAIFSIFFVIYNAVRARELVFSGPPPLTDGQERWGPDVSDAQVRSMMIDNLSELYRISNEAYESARSNYRDIVLVGATIALAAWISIFGISIGFLGWQAYPPLLVLAASLAPPLLAFAAFFLRYRRTVRPGVERARGWAERLERTYGAEVSNAVAMDGSSLQTVLEALPHLPEWLELRRKSMLFRHPGTTLVMLMLIVPAFSTSVFALNEWEAGGTVPAAVSTAAVAAMVAAAGHLCARQARADRAEAEGSMREFEGRMGRLNEFLSTDIREL